MAGIIILQSSYHILYCAKHFTCYIAVKDCSSFPLETSSTLLLCDKVTDTYIHSTARSKRKRQERLRRIRFYILKTIEKPEMGRTVYNESKDFILEIHFLLWNMPI